MTDEVAAQRKYCKHKEQLTLYVIVKHVQIYFILANRTNFTLFSKIQFDSSTKNKNKFWEWFHLGFSSMAQHYAVFKICRRCEAPLSPSTKASSSSLWPLWLAYTARARSNLWHNIEWTCELYNYYFWESVFSLTCGGWGFLVMTRWLSCVYS